MLYKLNALTAWLIQLCFKALRGGRKLYKNFSDNINNETPEIKKKQVTVEMNIITCLVPIYVLSIINKLTLKYFCCFLNSFKTMYIQSYTQESGLYEG